jgi:hypothetical protein
MTTTYLRFLLLLILSPFMAQGQVGMGGSAHSSAALDLKSTDKAFYPPRLTTAARNAIVDPQAGALVFDTDKNSLYLYDGTGWLTMATTTPELRPSPATSSDAGPNDQFGFSVAISGNYAIVGSPRATINGQNQGCAYIFVRNGTTWTQQAKINAPDDLTDDQFGTSVALSGEYALIGAPNADIGTAANQGAAYIFQRTSVNTTDTWNFVRKVVPYGPANTNSGTGVGILNTGSYVVGSSGYLSGQGKVTFGSVVD